MNWNKALDSLLPPFTEGKRNQPRDMLYIAQDQPPWPTTLSVGVQHVMVALMLLLYSVIAGQAMGLEGDQLRDFVALGLLITGFGTLLNALTTRVSAGHLLVNFQGPLGMTVFVAVVQAAGPGAAAGGVLVSGLVMLVLGRFLPKLRKLFPAEVSGVLLLLLGMSLIPGGIRRALGLHADAGSPLDLDSFLIAAITLGTIVGLSVWSVGRVRVLAMLIGTATGLLTAVLCGYFGTTDLAQLKIQAMMALPGQVYEPPTPTWALAAILPYLLASLMVAVDTLGSGVVIDKMNNDKWCRPDLPMIGRLLNGLGLCLLLNGLTGTVSSAVSSVNLGLAHITGVAARRAGVVAGFLLMILAFLPEITAAMILMPKPVIGAILIYTASYMMVSGAELILSRLLNARRRAIVGLSLVVGMAVFMVPELTVTLPMAIKPILGSGLMIGVCCAMLLNLLFLIGISREDELLLSRSNQAAEATRFLEERGAYWGARREVILRAGLAVGEALEALEQADLMTGPVLLRARYDEYILSLELEYAGQGLTLNLAPPVDAAHLLELAEDEIALDLAMAGVSTTLIRSLADRVRCKSLKGRGLLQLQFEH
jgi:xanthine/uracil permease